MLYRTSIIIYNKSHIPAILEFSRTDEKSLGSIAHEVIKDISAQTPEVLRAHVQELCRTLQEQAPTQDKRNDPAAIDNLKACALFARKFSKEIPQDKAFFQAMTRFALRGNPPETAKYAVSIIVAASQKKENIVEDLVHRCVRNFKYGSPGFLSQLVALSQLYLLVPAHVDSDGDAVIEIATKEIILQVRSTSDEDTETYKWNANMDEECSAKCYALRILVNRVLSHSDASTLQEIAEPVYALLTALISGEGELSTNNNTPLSHKPHLRLLAGRLLLKLSTSKPHEVLLTPASFNTIAQVAQDTVFQVRGSFLQRLKKYLAQTKLPPRFYAIPFLLAFEPEVSLKSETRTWIKSRATFFASIKSQQPTGTTSKTQQASKASTIMESVFARLLSLLAHHPDYGDSIDELLDSTRYMIFYLSTVANEDNISLIFHIAQRVKGYREVVAHSSSGPLSDTDYSERLYVLSDVAQAAITTFIETRGWSLQTLPSLTRLTLPRSLYAEIKDHELAISIAEKNFLPEAAKEEVETLVKDLRKKDKKRKSEGGEEGVKVKKVKRERTIPIRDGRGTRDRKRRSIGGKGEDWDDNENESEPEKARERGSSEIRDRRRSGRVSAVAGRDEKSYVERDDEEDERELEELNREREKTPDEAIQEDEEDSEGGVAEEAEDGDVAMSTHDNAVQAIEKEDTADIDDLPTPPASSPKATSKSKRNPKAPANTAKRSPAAKAKPPTKSKAKTNGKPAPRAKPQTTKKSTIAAAGGRATRSRAPAAAAAPAAAEHEDEDSDLSDAPDSE